MWIKNVILVKWILIKVSYFNWKVLYKIFSKVKYRDKKGKIDFFMINYEGICFVIGID